MTGGTAGVHRSNVRIMTGGAVTGGGFPRSQADQGAVGIMTAGTAVMDLRISSIDQRRRIVMTVGTGSCSNSYDGAVVH